MTNPSAPHPPSDSTPRAPWTRRDLLRRGVTVGLSATIAPSLLAACSGGDKSGGSTGAASSTPSPAPTGMTTAASPDTAATPTRGVFYPKGYVGPRASTQPAFGDGATFTVVVPEDTTVVGDWNKNSFTAWYEKRTGVKVKFQTVSTANNDMTKVNAMIASGDLPDAFMGIPFSRDQISLYGSQGVLAPLDDHIAEYGTELQHMMADYPDLRWLSKGTDGNTYLYPSIDDCFHCCISPGRAFVNKTFVDAGGGSIPETTEDLRAFLKALKANDASGHGDTIPLAAGVDNPIDRFFMNAFLYNPGEPWLRLDDGKVDFVANKDEWREALKYLRSLHDDGTLSPQVFTMTGQALQKLGNTPGHARIGVARCYYWGSFGDITYEKDARWRDYVPLPALKGPGGVRHAAWDYYSAYGYQMLVVTKKCADPAMMVRWADSLLELEATTGAFGGTKPKNWDWSKKGAESIMGKQAVFSLVKYPAPVGTSWNQNVVRYKSSDMRLSQEANPNSPTFESDLYQASKAPYEPYQQPKEWQLPPLIFDEAAAATNADTALAVSNHVKQSMAQFATGKLDVHDDGVWKTYTDKIDKMGLSQYLKNYQTAYDNRPTA